MIRRVVMRVLAVGLVVLVVQLVGWQDTVVDASGAEHVGRIASVGTREAVFRDGRRVAIEAPTAVRYGLGSTLPRLAENPRPAMLGVVAMLASLVLLQVRWLVMVRGAGLATPASEIFRMGWIGLFFSQVLPAGQSGGDLAKAYAIARAHPGRRVKAVVSVLADRGIGLFVLAAVAAAAVVAAPPHSRVVLARTVAIVFFAVSAAFLAMLFVKPLRDVLRLKQLAFRLPPGRFWFRVGRAFALYGRRPRHVLVSIVVGLGLHGAFLAAFYFLGVALGTRMSAFAVLVAIPVAQMAGNIPGLPAGWGFGDMAFYFFLPAAGVPVSIAVALSFAYRAVFMLLSLPGGLLVRAGA